MTQTKNMENESVLRKLQLIEKEMLDVFVSICERENLQYYLFAGTALGAYRHKGFIPWDDDIDVAMPRKDYDAFISIANKYLNDDMELYHYSTKKDYSDYTIKLVNTNAFLNIERASGVIKENVWIDVFPLDGSPNNKLMRYFHYRKLDILRWELALCYIDEVRLNENRSSFKNAVINIARIIPIGKLFNPIKICKRIDAQFLKNNYYHSDVVGNYLGPDHEIEMAPIQCYEEGCVVTFENNEYIAPKRIEDYLTYSYGNFMQLPPIEERKPKHHVVSVEFK